MASSEGGSPTTAKEAKVKKMAKRNAKDMMERLQYEIAEENSIEVEEEEETVNPNICRDCEKEVFENEKGLTCDICKCWFHAARRCQNVPQHAHDSICKDKTNQLHWFCSH